MRPPVQQVISANPFVTKNFSRLQSDNSKLGSSQISKTQG